MEEDAVPNKHPLLHQNIDNVTYLPICLGRYTSSAAAFSNFYGARDKQIIANQTEESAGGPVPLIRPSAHQPSAAEQPPSRPLCRHAPPATPSSKT